MSICNQQNRAEVGSPHILYALSSGYRTEFWGKFSYLFWKMGMTKCLYSDAHNVRNKQEKLEVCVQLQDYDLIGITGIWWDSS